MKLRDLLKEYRAVSLENDRKITEVMNSAKARLEEEFNDEYNR
jgi:hypothetical protein